MPDKYWEYLRLNDTDRSKVHFIPTAPNGDKLGGVSVSEKATWDGKYSKPSGGIPDTDLSSDVQASLDKADSALQSVPSTYRTSAAQDVIDATKVDKVTGKGLSTNDYDNTEKANVTANTAARHTHSNKSTLDNVQSGGFGYESSALTNVLTWDGDTTGLEASPNGIYYRLCDYDSNITVGNTSYTRSNGGHDAFPWSNIDASSAISGIEPNTVYGVYNTLIVNSVPFTHSMIGGTIRTGVWLGKELDGVYTSNLTIQNNAFPGTAVNQIQSKYIPTDTTKANNSIIADAYSASATYAVGDMCIYNGALYKCNTAITTAEVWTAAHWTAVVMGDEVTSLNQALVNKANYTDKLSQITGSMSDAEKTTLWSRGTSIKTAMDAVAVPGATYYLGEQTAVTVVLPTPSSPAVAGDPMTGQTVTVVFYSGASAATLSITGDTIGEVVTPSANQRVEVSMLWDGTMWAILSNVMDVPQDE